jgi:DNA-directed RNA polymerase sigma subunit (sigma70/sigma32)
VKIIARRIGVTATDVIYMNRRLGGDASLNAVIREDGEWQDRLVKQALRRRWPDVLLRLPLENLRMYGERKE